MPNRASSRRGRAGEVLRGLVGDGVPHPIGTEANARVRERVAETFRALGYQAEVHASFVCGPNATCATVNNVIAKRAGRDGFISFRFEGKTYKLDVTHTRTKKLFVKFRDGTSSKESYPPSRYLYTDPPKSGKVILDFNRAYSPPCAFTPYATCIFAPPQNTLPFRVEAGEIYRG